MAEYVEYDFEISCLKEKQKNPKPNIFCLVWLFVFLFSLSRMIDTRAVQC